MSKAKPTYVMCMHGIRNQINAAVSMLSVLDFSVVSLSNNAAVILIKT